MYGYVYLTEDLINNKIYIGQHKSENFDTSYYGSGIIISRMINKYGKENFRCSILEEADSFDDLNEKEIYWIEKLNSRDPNIGYNIASGGSFGDSGYHLGMLGKKQSDKQKLAASKANSYKRNDEIRLHMSAAKKVNHVNLIEKV